MPARSPALSVPVLLLALAAYPPLLAGQGSDSVQLREIVVTATRSPTPLHSIGSSTDRLGPEELRRRQLGSLREALQLAGGGTLLVNGAPGGVSSLFLRGVSSSQTLFLLDGIRVNDADASYGSLLGGAELGGMGRLEIVRGPQSTLYGGAAIGGVVALDAAAGSGRPRGEVEAAGGSFASWRGGIVAQGGSRSGRLGAALALSANGTDNQRRPNDWHQRTQLVRLDYRVSARLSAGTTFRGVQHEYWSPGDSRSTNTTPEGRTSFEHNQGTVWVEARPLGSWRSHLVAGLQEQYGDGTSRYDGGPESIYSLRNLRRVIDWENSLALGSRLILVAGLNQEWSTVKSDSEEQDQRLTGIFAEAQLSPVSSLTLTGGLRSDDYNTFSQATTYRVTAAWQVGSPGTKLRASWGTGFMPPGVAARFGSAFQNPNPEIRPERSRGWDAGIDQVLWQGSGRLSATWFHNSLTDLLGFESALFPEKGRSVNIDRARTSGLEVSGRLLVGPLDARTSYTLLSARSGSEPDPALARLIRRPRHTASLDLLFSITSRAALGAGGTAVADREDSDFNVFPSLRVNPGDYVVAHLYGSWEQGIITLRARAENLFNRSYEPVYGFPALGRSLRLSLGARF